MANTRVSVLAVAACCILAHTTAELVYPLNTIKLRLYSEDLSYKEFAAENATQIVPFLDLSNKTSLHCHGYTQSPEDLDLPLYTKNTVEGLNFNVIIADYRYVTSNLYPTAVALAKAVADVLRKAVEDMVSAGVNPNSVVLTGFSLGAQIAGNIARNLSFPLQQLMVMDPAGPLYDGTSLTAVSASDAVCVQCIHSDGGMYGSDVACGHQDYYPNGGVRYQPGCPIFSPLDSLQVCSHIRGQNYGGETSKYPNAYLGIQCNSWDDFKAGNCNSSNIVPMGLGAPCSAVGKFYLQTNYQSPYGLGQTGLTYNETLANVH